MAAPKAQAQAKPLPASSAKGQAGAAMTSPSASQSARAGDAERNKRKVRVGQVKSNKMQKTIVVQVRRLVRHGLYQRVIKQTNSFKVHDEKNEAKIGDWVKIMETRPLSRDKRWRLVEIVKQASTAPALPEGAEEQARHQAEAKRAAKAVRHAQVAGETGAAEASA